MEAEEEILKDYKKEGKTTNSKEEQGETYLGSLVFTCWLLCGSASGF